MLYQMHRFLIPIIFFTLAYMLFKGYETKTLFAVLFFLGGIGAFLEIFFDKYQ